MMQKGSKVVCIDDMGEEIEGHQIILSGHIPKKDGIYTIRELVCYPHPWESESPGLLLEGITAYNPGEITEMSFGHVHFREIEEQTYSETISATKDKELVLTH